MNHTRFGKRRLEFIVLDILSKEELHGYGIAEKIEEMYGVKKPSSGLIYPLLSDLKKRGFVEIAKMGKREKKTYRITEKGMRHLKKEGEEVEDAKKMMLSLGEFHHMGGYELIETIKLLMENLDHLDEKRKRKISKILRDSSKRLKMLVEFGETNE